MGREREREREKERERGQVSWNWSWTCVELFATIVFLTLGERNSWSFLELANRREGFFP